MSENLEGYEELSSPVGTHNHDTIEDSLALFSPHSRRSQAQTFPCVCFLLKKQSNVCNIQS